MLQSIANRSPTVNEVYLQHEQKFRGIEVQFQERDVRADRAAIDTKRAVDAALAAQENAVAKQNESFALATSKAELATTKQIDQSQLQIATVVRTVDDKVNDLKERLTRIEGMGAGRKDFYGWIIGGIGLLIAVLAYIRR